MQPIYVSKILAALSSAGIAKISSNNSSAGTINSSQLDTARRIAIISSIGADLSGITFTITGTREGGGVIRETLLGSTGTTIRLTTQDFASVTSVVASSAVNVNGGAMFGTSSAGGTPWRVANWHANPMILSAGITLSSSGNSATGVIEITMDDPSGVYSSSSTIQTIFASTSRVCTAVSTNTWGVINVDGQTTPPIAAWRLTITSTSATTTVSAAVMQSGIG